jgi:hypothetical protein
MFGKGHRIITEDILFPLGPPFFEGSLTFFGIAPPVFLMAGFPCFGIGLPFPDGPGFGLEVAPAFSEGPPVLEGIFFVGGFLFTGVFPFVVGLPFSQELISILR